MKQNNPLYDKFLQIKEYCDKIEDLNIDTYKIFPSATKESICQWESENNAKLPEGYKNWLLLSNGLDVKSNGEICGVEEIFELELPDYEGYYRIGAYIGDGSMLLIDKEGNFYKDDHCFGREKSDFEDFLEEWIIGHLRDEIEDNS